MRKWVFLEKFDDSHVLSVHRLVHQKAAKNATGILMCTNLKRTYQIIKLLESFIVPLHEISFKFGVGEISNFHFPFISQKMFSISQHTSFNFQSALLKINLRALHSGEEIHLLSQFSLVYDIPICSSVWLTPKLILSPKLIRLSCWQGISNVRYQICKL